MRVLNTLLLLQVVHLSRCSDQLRLAYEWKVLDYQFPSQELREQALNEGTFVPENNVPVGLEAFGDRLFLTVPRLRAGVPSSLNYVHLNDNSKSPVLKPYPNWAAHNMTGEEAPAIVSPFRIRADRCSRLWVLDDGVYHHANNTLKQFPPKFIIYDLKTDNPLRTYEIPKDQLKADSKLINIAVEVIGCNNTFAYGVDSAGALVVYSWAENKSWRVKYNYFNLAPLAKEFRIRTHNYTKEKHLISVALSAPKGNYSTMYFHPHEYNDEFEVSTEFLRNGQENFYKFTRLGIRKTYVPSTASFLDPKTGVLFYALVDHDAVACWKISNKAYEIQKRDLLFHLSTGNLINTSDIKVDQNDTLWILSSKLPLFQFEKLNTTEVNFRVYSAPVIDAINHTVCDITARSHIAENIPNNINSSESTGLPKEVILSEISQSDKDINSSEPTDLPKKVILSEISQSDKDINSSEPTDLPKKVIQSEISQSDKDINSSESTDLPKKVILSEISQSDKDINSSEPTDLPKKVIQSEISQSDKDNITSSKNAAAEKIHNSGVVTSFVSCALLLSTFVSFINRLNM